MREQEPKHECVTVFLISPSPPS